MSDLYDCEFDEDCAAPATVRGADGSWFCEEHSPAALTVKALAVKLAGILTFAERVARDRRAPVYLRRQAERTANDARALLAKIEQEATP